MDNMSLILQSSNIMILNSTKFGGNRTKMWKLVRTDGQTDRQTDRPIPIYPPKLCLRGIYKATGKIFWPVSQRMQINFIFTDNVHISCLSCSVKKSKTATTLFQLAETSVVLINHFPWCPLWSPCLCCYRFLPSLYTNRIPEKNDIDPWLAG